jgi:osmotically-inducible protein OsmY
MLLRDVEPYSEPHCVMRANVDLESKVKNRLWCWGFRGGPRLSVTAQAGWVTISGQVNWAFEKRMALHVLRGTPGVTGVTDKLVRIYQMQAEATTHGTGPLHGTDAVTRSRWS